MSGVYVHIPFCRRKCLYCDFYSLGERLADWPRFIDAITREASIRIQSAEFLSHESPLTLYIGGGTPSLIPPDDFQNLSSSLLRIIGNPMEFTLEVNPDDVNPEKVATWHKAGVNRISMGVQSLVDSELLAVGRRQSSLDAENAFRMLRKAFSNISLDLMFGLPGQSVKSLGRSLDGILDLEPEHISVYSLMYEERTALTRLRESGKIPEIPEEDSEAMFYLVNRILGKAGYERYEISNYSKPGFRSHHNSSYWNGSPYIGLGPAAHSYDGFRTRSANMPDIKSYLEYYGRENASIAGLKESIIKQTENIRSLEILSDTELREEMIMTRLRTAEGLSIPEFSNRFGPMATHYLLESAEKWISIGSLVISSDKFLSLTDKGIMISDEIISSLF